MKIPIVNENDEVIGMEERSVIHSQGLKHREIHVWLVTPEREFIFQKRALDKDTWPGYLDVTVGGHVDTVDETYEKTAERELLEETGVSVTIQFITKTYSESFDPSTQTYNNAFRTTFAGVYTGDMSDLKVEEDSALGFQKFSLDALMSLNEKQKAQIIPGLFRNSYPEMYEKILSILFK